MLPDAADGCQSPSQGHLLSKCPDAQESVIGQPHSPAQFAGADGPQPAPAGFPQQGSGSAPQWKPTASAASPPSRPASTIDVRTVTPRGLS